MRHKKGFNHLGRKTAHRNAMLSNMAVSLIKFKRISTTLAKAKELRKFVEPIITRAKDTTSHNQRMAFSYLQDKEAVKILFGEIASRIANRPGGYTRILKTGYRDGDNAETCIIELVDYNESLLKPVAAKTVKTGRTRRGTSKAKTEVASVEPAKETPTTETELKTEE